MVLRLMDVALWTVALGLVTTRLCGVTAASGAKSFYGVDLAKLAWVLAQSHQQPRLASWRCWCEQPWSGSRCSLVSGRSLRARGGGDIGKVGGGSNQTE